MSGVYDIGRPKKAPSMEDVFPKHTKNDDAGPTHNDRVHDEDGRSTDSDYHPFGYSECVWYGRNFFLI